VHPRRRSIAQRHCERLQRLVDLEIERRGKLGVRGRIAERADVERLEKLFQAAGAAPAMLGTATPIMQSRVTIPARRSSLQPSVPAGRIGSTM
jgi:hypothetical protein